MAKTCCIPGCNKPVKGRGMCNRHYMQWWSTQHRKERHANKKRWRQQNVDLRNQQRKRNYHQGNDCNRNSHRVYRETDKKIILAKKMLIAGKMQDVSDREIAQFLGRTVQAIQGERHLLKNQ